MELYGFKNFDELIAFHCAPVLMGQKVANMISLKNSNNDSAETIVSNYNKEFNQQDIFFRKLCCCSKRSLLLVYNKKQLEDLLQEKGYRAYLTAAGYEMSNTLEDDLQTLEQRLQLEKTFPHEIGVFLGYPLEDVLGFVLNKGSNCKYSGYWKVYGNVSEAQKLFATYEKCRDYILQKLTEGKPLHLAAGSV